MTRLEELKANAEAADAACDTALDAAWVVYDAAVDAAEIARCAAWNAYYDAVAAFDREDTRGETE
jgi:hypothetical protein